MDAYEVLGVAPDASAADVRAAYLRLARQHHPDGHTASGAAAVARAERRMREVNAAWSVLRDPEARRRLDEERDGGPLPPSTANVRPAAGPTWRPRADDTGWMDDFEAWKHEDHDFVPSETPRSTGRQLATMLPVAVFAASVVVGSVAMVLDAPVLVALAFLGVAVSAVLFLGLTLLEMRGGGSR